MPVPPSIYAGSAVIPAGQLDTDLYTYAPGNNHAPNGILFHTLRPLLIEGLSASIGQVSSAAGTNQGLTGSNFWTNYIDNGVYFGPGADFPGATADGHFLATVPGSAGAAGSAGGYYLFWGFPAIVETTNAGAYGAAIDANGGTVTTGGHQLSTTTRNQCAYVLDLMLAGTAISALIGYCADTSGGTFASRFNAIDYSGELSRYYALWAGVAAGGQTVAALPSPQTSYTANSEITSTLLNGTSGIGGTLTFLNNPPMLRAANFNSSTVADSTVTTVPVAGNTAGPQVDSYGKLNTSTYTYTVPISGVYLVHGAVNFAASTTAQRQAGIQVNGSLNLWGPSYQAAAIGTTVPQVTRLLDLHAGDTLKLVAQQNTGAGLAFGGTGAPCRLVAVWLGALWGGGTTLGWTPPDTGFRWQAGTPGQDLPAQWQDHMANDLNFLINRPYLLTYQSSAQSGLAVGSYDVITMGAATGRVHATPGDNYGGWTAGSGNHYTAQIDGWYLVCAGYFAAASQGTVHPIAAIKQTPAGSVTPDLFQHVPTSTTTYPGGAEAVGLYYLRAGDQVQPVFQLQDAASSWSTTAAAGDESHFEAIWVSS